jgi:hypothetical protein
MKTIKSWLKLFRKPNLRRPKQEFYANLNGKHFYNTSPWREAEREAQLEAQYANHKDIYDSEYED